VSRKKSGVTGVAAATAVVKAARVAQVRKPAKAVASAAGKRLLRH